MKLVSKKIIMNENSLDRSPIEHLLDLDLDKDTWIYTYGSTQLQQVRSFGYDCESQYLKERLKAEYPGFKLNTGSVAKKLDFPAMYAIQESLKWNDAYIAKQYHHGEVIAIDLYLGKYQIVKKTTKPWHLMYRNLDGNHPAFLGTLLGAAMTTIFWLTMWI